MRRAVTALRGRGGTDRAIGRFGAERRPAIEALSLPRGRGIRRNLRQPLRDGLGPRFNQRVTLKMRGLREFVKLLQIIGASGLGG